MVYSPHVHRSFLQIQQENVMCFFAASKSFNIAGLHVSVCVSYDSHLKELLSFKQKEIHLVSTNVFGLAALEAALVKCDHWLVDFKEYLL